MQPTPSSRLICVFMITTVTTGDDVIRHHLNRPSNAESEARIALSVSGFSLDLCSIADSTCGNTTQKSHGRHPGFNLCLDCGQFRPGSVCKSSSVEGDVSTASLRARAAMEVPDIDPNFEPQTRVRSNTWPLRPREFTKEDENRSTPNGEAGGAETPTKQGDALGLSGKKTSSRRNAWGNLSYADLITKAIDSSPEKRLTLSQIYDWMVQNVPYFKDKGESNSSAGWKVRLSLWLVVPGGGQD